MPPSSSSTWLPESATEWIASASIDDDPGQREREELGHGDADVRQQGSDDCPRCTALGRHARRRIWRRLSRRVPRGGTPRRSCRSRAGRRSGRRRWRPRRRSVSSRTPCVAGGPRRAGRGSRSRSGPSSRRRAPPGPVDAPGRRRRTGRRTRRPARSASSTGSRCSASAASAVRPVARRIDSAIRRAARAASTVPPHSSGVESAMPMARILAGLTARSLCGQQVTATSSRASATTSGSVCGPRCSAVQQVEHHDRDRELVAGLGRQHRGVAPLGVLGDQRALRGGHHQLAAAPYRLGHGAGRGLVASLGREHHDEVEAAGPAGEPGPGPGDERHRADRLEHGAQQPRVRAGGHHGARPDLGEPLDRLGERPRRPRPASRRTRAPDSARVPQATSARARAASSSRSRRRTSSGLGAGLRLARLVDEQHRDVVA